MENLNKIRVHGKPLKDHTLVSGSSGTCAYFRGLDKHLIKHIRAAPAVVGCVAWLAHEGILKALADCTAVSIVVQKEDYLRPDAMDGEDYLRKRQELYRELHGRFWRYDETIGYPYMMSVYRKDASIDAIRCVGYSKPKAGNLAARPNMHNKFLVFCRYDSEETMGYNGDPYEAVDGITPYGVWTGSFNFTNNGTKSFENAVYLVEPDIVKAYFMEWSQLVAISEPLDWAKPTVDPEWEPRWDPNSPGKAT
jgi:hypothetical protein